MINKSAEQTKELLWNALESGDPCYFLRFGDGDMQLMDDWEREKHHINSPELRDDLIESLCFEAPNYYKASRAGRFGDGLGSYNAFVPKSIPLKSRRGQRIMFKTDRYLNKIQYELCPDGTYYHLHIFQYLFEHESDWLKSWLKLLANKRVLLIAGDKICESPLVKELYNVETAIAFPGTDGAYYHLDEFLPEIMRQVPEHDVILPVIGLATRVLGRLLYTAGYADKILIDIGVITTVLAGIVDRGWTRRAIEAGSLDAYKN